MDAHDHKMFPHQGGNDNNNSSSKQDVGENGSGIQYRGEGIDVDKEF